MEKERNSELHTETKIVQRRLEHLNPLPCVPEDARFEINFPREGCFLAVPMCIVLEQACLTRESK